MSALEQTPLPQLSGDAVERRSAPRLRITDSLPILLGRGEGVLVDLSENGARVRHTMQALRGSSVRFSFEWHGERFAATAEVLSSRVVALGTGHRPTMYESRLRFRVVPDVSRELLLRVLASIENGDVRRWVANLQGWTADPHGAAVSSTGAGDSFLRCRLIGRRWERKWTHERAQPKDGFVLPDSVDAKEVESLCETYEKLDADGRHLIRLIAAASMS